MKYEKRIVLFLDIMGFSKTVDDSVNNVQLFEKIFKTLTKIYSDKVKKYDGPLKGVDNGTQISTFSDCMVISAPFQEQGSWFFFVHSAYWLINEILWEGFLVRGSIVIGDLYHDNRIVFGPALNIAVHNESKVANYPRVLVNDDDYTNAISTTAMYGDVEEEKRLLDYLIRKDTDGWLFIDYLSKHHEFDDFETYIELLVKVKDIINKGLTISDSHVLEKYHWLKRYYNSIYDSDADSRLPGIVK